MYRIIKSPHIMEPSSETGTLTGAVSNLSYQEHVIIININLH
jgi:hypothetical protein